ncbi:MAG: amidase [Nannocystaceae bacterium]
MQAREYLEHDATALAERVRNKEVSPAELLERAIAQVEAHNPRINAVIHRMFDLARAEVSRGLPQGPFRGVPFLLKDLAADYAGTPTTAGSRYLARRIPTADSEITRRYKAAGLVILGKTNTPELGLMGVTEPELHGPSRNPYHGDHTPGGSSGGSAAAVGARLVPAAHGGDGGGSIRIPASTCGLVGLKPTRGRTPMGPDRGERWSGLVVQHVLTRSVRDSAGLLDATAGPELGSTSCAPPVERPFVQEVGRDPGRLRIAFTTDALLLGQLHPECRHAVEQTAEHLAALGHDVEPARPRLDADGLAEAYLTTVAANVCAELAVAERRLGPAGRDELELPTWIMREIGRATGAGRLIELQQLQAETAWTMARFHQRYDLLLTATCARPPARVGELLPGRLERLGLRVLRRLPLRPLLQQAFAAARKQLASYPNTQVFNMTGQPAISVPTHVSPEGLPIGVQLVAPFGDEATLLRVASQLETELHWGARRPAFLQ